MYTSIQEDPNGEDQEDNDEEVKQVLFNEDGENEDDDENDKRSYQSEEAMKPEEITKLNPKQLVEIEHRKQEREQVKMESLSSELKERFGMQEFDIEIHKIDQTINN